MKIQVSHELLLALANVDPTMPGSPYNCETSEGEGDTDFCPLCETWNREGLREFGHSDACPWLALRTHLIYNGAVKVAGELTHVFIKSNWTDFFCQFCKVKYEDVWKSLETCKQRSEREKLELMFPAEILAKAESER